MKCYSFIAQGTHDELMAKQGAYFELVQSQQFVTTGGESGKNTPRSRSTQPTPKAQRKSSLAHVASAAPPHAVVVDMQEEAGRGSSVAAGGTSATVPEADEEQEENGEKDSASEPPTYAELLSLGLLTASEFIQGPDGKIYTESTI